MHYHAVEYTYLIYAIDPEVLECSMACYPRRQGCYAGENGCSLHERYNEEDMRNETVKGSSAQIEVLTMGPDPQLYTPCCRLR